MGRIISKKEYELRKRFDSKISNLTDELNNAIKVAFENGYSADVSVDIRCLVDRPVIRVNFFRDDDIIEK